MRYKYPNEAPSKEELKDWFQMLLRLKPQPTGEWAYAFQMLAFVLGEPEGKFIGDALEKLRYDWQVEQAGKSWADAQRYARTKKGV